MKNLELFQLVDHSATDHVSSVSHIAIYNNYKFWIKDESLLFLLPNETVEFYDDERWSCITQFEILKTEKLLWFGTGDEFVWVDFSKQLHTVQYEFVAAVWNPSKDAIAVVQPDGRVQVLVINFKDELVVPIGTSHLTDVTPNPVINVGWGSESTQFRGTVGKIVKDENEEIPVIRRVCNRLDVQPRISWRGNGEMFAVNYSHEKQRKFKVFKYPCELLYESSEIVGLQPIIAWRPEGNLIAGITHTNRKCELSLFEKNGLIKNSVLLKQNPKLVLDLKWSSCGQVLAIHQCLNEYRQYWPLKNDTFIDLYTTKNYVWYLKQRLNFSIDNPVTKFEFNETLSAIVSLRVVTELKTMTYFFKFVNHVSPLYENKNSVTCAVINGKNIWLTDCEKGIAPPPMFDRKIASDEPVNFIQFHPTQPKLAVVDCSNCIYTYNLETCVLIEILHNLQDDILAIPLACHHFLWFSNSQLMCLIQEKDNTYKVVIDTNDKNLSYWLNDRNAALSAGVTYLDSVYTDNIYIQQADKEITVFGSDNSSIIKHKLPSHALSLRYVKINNTPLVLSLTPSQEFFVNEELTLTGVLSFIIHQNYLMLTTVQSTLICIRLNMLLVTNNLLKNAYCRSVEQGSYLLFGLPNSSSVILQMPRGNVEICTVRLVSVDRLETLLEQQNWKEAIDLVRLERMNTTILVDLNFNRFIKNIDKFVKSIENPSVINEFLLGLQEQNVFTTLYKECAFGKPQDVTEKVEKVCSTLIGYLENYNYRQYLNCIIIACCVKDSKSSNYDALCHIQNLLHAMKEDRSIITVVESAFNGINTLKPNSDMYHNALLMYDLDLALFVARNLQMDPKEYEPFIKNLMECNEVKRRFVINDYLKNFNTAVKYLLRCSDNDEEIVDYVKKYQVYDAAYNNTKHGSELHKQMAIMFAEHLRKQKFYEEAAIVLCSVQLFNDAFEDYKEGLVITGAVLTLYQMNLSTSEQKQKLRELAEACIADRRITDAGRIYEMYLLDYDTAMDLYIRNHYFSEAVNCGAKFNCYNDYKLLMFEVVLSYSDELTIKLKTMKDTFNKYRARLVVVKTGKIQKLTDAFDKDLLTIVDDSMSIADTVSTAVTSSSRVSTASRRRRKVERKKQDLREGGVYEDIALMRALYELISEVFALGPTVRELCLLTFNVDSSGNMVLSTLHNFLLEFQLEINKAITEIWPPHLNDPEDDDPASNVYDNVKVLDVKYREPPSNLDTNWKLHIMSNAS